MAELRCGKKISFENRNSRRHGFHAPAKPNRIGKTKPKVNNTGGQSRTRPPKIDFDALTRNIRFGQRARAHELATGDSADTLREKRRWVQQEFDCSRIDGKVTRELHDLYSKKIIGKIERQRTKAQNLSNAAKEVKQRLEQVFQERSGAGPAAGAMGQPLADDPDDEAVGEPSDGEAVCDAPDREATGQAVESATESEGDLAVKDESSTEEDNYANHSNPTAARTAAENDAAARQWAIEHGYELYDPTIHGTGVGEGEEGEGEEGEGEEGEGEEGEGEEGEGEEGEGEEGEGEEEVEVKMEEGTYE